MLLTRQQLEERLVALHRASLELVKEVSLETLLERIATVALEQVNARYAALGVQDEQGKLVQFITVGMTPEEKNRMAHPPVGRGLIAAVMNTEYPIRVPEIGSDPRSVGFPNNHPPMGSFLGVPIRQGEKQLGQIYLTDKIGLPEFTSDDEDIIEMLATYAAVAIQNARLYGDLRERDKAITRRNEDLALLNDIASVLTSSLELDDILNKTLALVMNYLKAEAGEIFLVTDDNKSLRLVIHHGEEGASAFWARTHYKMGESLVGQVALQGGMLILNSPQEMSEYINPDMLAAGFKQVACFPLISTGKVIGVLSTATDKIPLLEDSDVQLVESVCGWAGLAIENARLHSNGRRLAVLEERERIGMDLHDGIIQSIYGVGLVLEHARLLAEEDSQHAQIRIQQAISDLNRTIRDIRSYILDLRPRQLGEDNLMLGLRQLVTEYRSNTLAEAVLSGSAEDVADLSQDNALALFHICQEALANAAKHSAAKKVEVNVWATADRILMEILDNGKGFDLAKKSMTLGHGLSNMHTRAQHVGGEVEITSAPGEGASILAWVPRG